MLAKRPPFSAVRSLINCPVREAFSSSGELTSQENPLPESFSHLVPSIGNTSAGNRNDQTLFEENISTENSPVPEETTPEITACENVSVADSAGTADNSRPAVNQTNETQGEQPSTGTHLPSKSTGFTVPLFSSLGDRFEMQLKPAPVVPHPQQWCEKAHFSCYLDFANGLLWGPRSAALCQAHV